MQTKHTIEGLLNLARAPDASANAAFEEAKMLAVLRALVTSDDPRLMESFPTLLGLFAQRGLSVSLVPLFETHARETHHSEILQKLVWVTLCLFREKGLSFPEDPIELETFLKNKWGDLGSSQVLDLGSGLSLRVNRIRRIFSEQMGLPLSRPLAEHALTSSCPELLTSLKLLFSPRQQELIFKKLNKERLTKTEREYFSRVVKKKLKALADKNLHQLASRLVSK